MKIKRLAIQGFKSFPDRTQFTFPPRTSAIVGPNGCGKSNIVDAIRWVLGEHNARHLRGRLMEDLIFGGSENRKTTGMAEVAMTLSNEGGLAPARYADFTEIEVQRRLYRSGESEYFINKVPCRLKDIVELFTDTGIGTNTYSIIEQGRVGWLVSAKPEERRAIFEEAAGINKFKQKKEASLRRLDATKQNLTRVSDIISEVKRQLNSLNRQAKKAERYKKLKDELKGYELFLSKRDFSKQAGEKGAAEKSLAEINDRELALQTAVDELGARVEGLKLEHLKKETEFKEFREAAEAVETRIREEERSGELLRLRTGELQRNEERLTGEIEELSAKGSQLDVEMKELGQKIAKTEASLNSVAERLGAEELKLFQLNEEFSAKGEEVAASEVKAVEGAAKLSDLKHSMHMAIKEEEALREREARAVGEREEAIRELAVTGEPLAKLRGSLGDFETRKGGIEKGLSDVEGRLKGLAAERDRIEEELRGAKEDWAKKSSRLGTLEEMSKSLEGVDRGVKTIVKEGLRGRSNAVHGLISDIIEIEPGYEKAVEAVLGERLKYVIVDTQAEGMEAVEQLKAGHVGRGSFLPVKEARPVEMPQADYIRSLGQGVAMELKSKVTVKEGYRATIDSLLSDAVLVHDLNSARSLWKRNGAQVVFVTPEGEMIDKQGVVTGGYSNGSGPAGGMLQKRREISEMGIDVSRLRERISALEAALDRKGEEIVKAGVEVESLRCALHAEDLGKANLSSELRIHEEDVARLASRRDELAGELEEIRGALSEVVSRKAAIAAERDSLEAKLGEMEVALVALKEGHSGITEAKEELSTRVTEIKVEHASNTERFDALRGLLAEKEVFKGETFARLESKRREIEDGVRERGEAAGKIEEIKTRLADALAERDRAKTIENSKREEIDALVEELRLLDRQGTGRRKEQAGLQEEKSRNSLKIKEADLALANLKERIIEKYGVSIEDYAPNDEDIGGLEGEELDAKVAELRERMGRMGEVSLAALDEYKELDERYQFLLEQQADLERSVESLLSAISRINRTTRERFKKTFDEINEKFRETFPKFFNGGRAELRLSEEGNILESGVEIVAQPPGKKLQNIMLLSGGEKALTATALIFSIFLIKPSPFCLLDEVDAPLDDANIERFNGFVKEMSHKSQFILITHNKRTMEVADTLYGITMEEPGVSKSVSVEF